MLPFFCLSTCLHGIHPIVFCTSLFCTTLYLVYAILMHSERYIINWHSHMQTDHCLCRVLQLCKSHFTQNYVFYTDVLHGLPRAFCSCNTHLCSWAFFFAHTSCLPFDSLIQSPLKSVIDFEELWIRLKISSKGNNSGPDSHLW